VNNEQLVGAASAARPATRLSYLDWMRGLAAVVMLQGHVFHSFSARELREGGPFVLSQFFGGMPPAIFLFLTGVTLAFLMDSSERRGLAGPGRVAAVLRRSGYLFAMAFLFRIQLWLFAWPHSPWTDLFKVDILNCMGLGIAAMAAMTVFTTVDRVRLCAVLGVAIAGLSPVVSAIDWTGSPQLLRTYLVPSYDYFGFFPWAAYLAFGVSAGSLLRLARTEESAERAIQWAAVFGLALAAGAYYLSSIPFSIYGNSEFWLNSPAQVFIKLGVILALLAFAYVWNRWVVGDSWNWLRQLGTTSLLVYWVHIELVYGRWVWWWKDSLGTGATVAAAAAVIALMVALSVARTRWRELRDWAAAFQRPVGQEE
jgi:uncharacterized membrane protein